MERSGCRAMIRLVMSVTCGYSIVPRSTNMMVPSKEQAANTTRHPPLPLVLVLLLLALPPPLLLLLLLFPLLLPGSVAMVDFDDDNVTDDDDDDDGGGVSVCVCMVHAISVAAPLKASRSTITGVCLLVLHRLT